MLTALTIILYREVQNENYELDFRIQQIKLNSIEKHIKTHLFQLNKPLWNPAQTSLTLPVGEFLFFFYYIYLTKMLYTLQKIRIEYHNILNANQHVACIT